MRSSIIEYTLAVFLIIATILVVVAACSQGPIGQAEILHQGLPFHYSYKFVEIEGMNCILVTSPVLPEGIAIDCDWRK